MNQGCRDVTASGLLFAQVFPNPDVEILEVDSSRGQHHLLLAVDRRNRGVPAVHIQAHETGGLRRRLSLLHITLLTPGRLRTRKDWGAVEGYWCHTPIRVGPVSLPGSQLS